MVVWSEGWTYLLLLYFGPTSPPPPSSGVASVNKVALVGVRKKMIARVVAMTLVKVSKLLKMMLIPLQMRSKLLLHV